MSTNATETKKKKTFCQQKWPTSILHTKEAGAKAEAEANKSEKTVDFMVQEMQRKIPSSIGEEAVMKRAQIAFAWHDGRRLLARLFGLDREIHRFNLFV